jgi:hypothetical protein
VSAAIVTVGLGMMPSAASAAERLPDLNQSAPRNLVITKSGADWRLGFDSETVNMGSAGPLRIDGARASVQDPMEPTQIITNDDGTTTRYVDPRCTSASPPSSCGMLYVDGGGHSHWHLLDFEIFELAKRDKVKVRRDSKTGFCLAASSPDRCRTGVPTALDVSMGLNPGIGDTYPANVEGQYIKITNLPSDVYILRHYSNALGTIKERSTANNGSSLRIYLTKATKSDGYTVRILNTCPDSDFCPPAPTAVAARNASLNRLTWNRNRAFRAAHPRLCGLRGFTL